MYGNSGYVNDKKKPKIHLIMYGDGGNIDWKTTKNRLIRQAEEFNVFDTIKSYSYDDLSSNFKKKYNKILKYKRGGGFWCWKIDIIQQTLNITNENDYIIYLDTGCSINKHIEAKKRFFEYLNMLENSKFGAIYFETQELIKSRTTNQILNYFNLNPDDLNRGACVPGALIMKNNKHIHDVLDDFTKLLDFDYNLITDNYNKTKQHKYWLGDNRHDQSIFSCLFLKHGAVFIKGK